MPLAAECDGDEEEVVETEINFPVMNWVMVLLSQFLISITWALIIPSMHQFVTNPTESALRKQNTTSSHSTDEVYKYEAYYGNFLTLICDSLACPIGRSYHMAWNG